jgi:hypothetical protein
MLKALRSAIHRCRTAIITANAEQYAQIEAYSVPLQLDAVDYVRLILRRLPEASQFVHITAATIESDLYQLATSQQHSGAMVYNIDIALAKLGVEQREHFWRNIRERFPYHKPLVIILPETAVSLLIDESELLHWRQSGRLTSLSTMEETV